MQIYNNLSNVLVKQVRHIKENCYYSTIKHNLYTDFKKRIFLHKIFLKESKTWLIKYKFIIVSNICDILSL
jgi:hypothetical protein